MYKNELPLIFDRQFKGFTNKPGNVKNYIKPLKNFPYKINQSDDKYPFSNRKYLRGIKGLNYNSNNNNLGISVDNKKNNSSQSQWTINIIIPKKRDLIPIVKEDIENDNDMKKDRNNNLNEDIVNNMFLTKCGFYGKTRLERQNEINKENNINNERSSNVSDLGLLLRQLEINKEKIDFEREDLEKMIKSTKHTHEKISGITRYGQRFFNLHNNNKYKKKPISP